MDTNKTAVLKADIAELERQERDISAKKIDLQKQLQLAEAQPVQFPKPTGQTLADIHAKEEQEAKRKQGTAGWT